MRGIGLFHVHGHQAACYPRYSPDFMQGVGQVDGEVVETLWALMNDVSRCCRGMTAPHRQEVLDDHMADSNWQKLVRMGKCIRLQSRRFSSPVVGRVQKKYPRALKMRAESQSAFAALDSNIEAAQRARWLQLEQDALQKRWEDPTAMDCFDVSLEKGARKRYDCGCFTEACISTRKGSTAGETRRNGGRNR